MIVGNKILTSVVYTYVYYIMAWAVVYYLWVVADTSDTII